MITGRVEERLAAIERGQRAMVLTAQERLAQAIEALLDGEFDAAYDRASEAVAKLSPLMSAERGALPLAKGAVVKRARDVEEGETIIGWGVVREPPELFEAAGVAEGVRLRWTDPLGKDREQTVEADGEYLIAPPEGS